MLEDFEAMNVFKSKCIHHLSLFGGRRPGVRTHQRSIASENVKQVNIFFLWERPPGSNGMAEVVDIFRFTYFDQVLMIDGAIRFGNVTR